MADARLDFASWPIRLVAYLIDDVLPTIGIGLFILGVGLSLGLSLQNFGGENPAGLIFTMAAITMLVAGVGLLIGYFVWWLIVLGRAQTPGKQIVGIRAVNYVGEPLSRGMMFVREFLVKGLLFGLLYALTLGILFLVDNLWPLWDNKKQALHDKIVNTYVVYVPRN